MKNLVSMTKEATPDKAIIPTAFVIEPEKLSTSYEKRQQISNQIVLTTS